MLTYSYRCDYCGKSFDKYFETLKDSTDIKIICPYCNKYSVTKLITLPAIIFKGNGFYKNANRNSKSG